MYMVNLKIPNTKFTIFQKCAIFLYQFFLLICLGDNCAKNAALCSIYLTYAKMTEMQTSRTNFATVQTVQKADFIIKVIECPIPPLLRCHCDVGIIIWFAMNKINNFFQYFKS